MHKFIQTVALATFSSVLLFPTLATSRELNHCGYSHAACYKGCGVPGTDSDLGERRCRIPCDLKLMKCMDKEAKAKGSGKGSNFQGDKGLKGGGVVKVLTPQPKASGGTRAPLAGGVLSTSPASGSGTPISKSGGARQ